MLCVICCSALHVLFQDVAKGENPYLGMLFLWQMEKKNHQNIGFVTASFRIGAYHFFHISVARIGKMAKSDINQVWTVIVLSLEGAH